MKNITNNTKTKQPAHPQYGFLNNSVYHWKEMISREPLAAAGILILTFTGLTLPLLHAALPRLLLQGLEERWEMTVFLVQFAVLAVCIIIGEMLRAGFQIQIKRAQGPFEDAYNLRMLKKRLLVDYEILESKRFNEEAHSVYDSLYRRNAEMKDAMMVWQKCLMATAGLVLYGMILLRQSLLLLLLILIPTLLTFLLRGGARKKDMALRIKAEESVRKMTYVEEKATDFKAGKDIRLFELADWLLSIMKREEATSGGYVRQWENGYMAVNLFDALLCFLRDACAYLFLIVRIVEGRLLVADFVWYMAFVANCQQSCSALLEVGERLGKLDMDYERLRSFLDSDNGQALRGVANSGGAADSRSAADSGKAAAVHFSHVSFSYPESDAPTLRELDFTIQPGEKIALVGRNGAGKTTLVKLLCGLYMPTQGSIEVDGVEIGDYSKEDYFGLLSVVFQNVKLLPLSIARNVAPSEGENADRERIRRCLEMAGLWPMVDGLPEKEDTSLGKGITEGGIELSGGEAQKLWMARALYKEAPLLILDEPTVALDLIAEYEIYTGFHEVIGDKTALFISHRLSACRFSQEIMVFEEGKVVQKGSHEELTARPGLYQRMWEAQAQYYQ